MLRLVGCLTQQHDDWLVGVAALICALACAAALNLIGRALAADGRERLAWLAAVAVAFGGGVWATHFVAMLAYRPGLPFGFVVPLTIVSFVLPIVGSGLGFAVLAYASRVAGAPLLAGLLVGVSAAAMHFTGMAAMRAAATVAYDRPTALVAVLVGVLFASLALHVSGRGRPMLAAALLALAVCGMHFTAMSAVTLTPTGVANPDIGTLTTGPLAIGVAVVAVLILALSLTAAAMEGRRVCRLEAEARRLRRLLDSTFEGILFHRNGVITEVNARLCTLLGRERSALVGRDVLAVLGAEALPQAGPDGEAVAVEADLHGADGRLHPVELLARPLADAGGGEFVVAVRDLSERKRAEQRIQHLAHHDPLTGLANRVLFGDIATKALSLADRSHRGVALLCLDLDGFKAVNDMYGHPAGDRLLAAVAGRLAGTIRQMDTAARVGSDEFAILQPLAEQPQAGASLAERIVRLLAHPFEIGGESVTIGASVGIALYPNDAGTIEDLLRSADLAMYRAKSEGKNAFRFFEPGMDARMRERRQMEIDLRDALANNELELYYQGQFDGVRLDVIGYEALLRWTHKRLGRISPAVFIPIAEGSGLIRQLGQWVLETACREAVGWPRPLRLAVNLSPAQFKWADLPQQIIDTLARTGLPPERLELEVTEGVLIEDTDRALAILRELKAHGVRIALDDFGTGYSSLSYLRRFPFDSLKIDKSFVQAIGEDAEADAIVRAVIGLGRSLNLDVVAEGVETPQQLAHLRALNCHQLQGFLLARPLPAADLPHAVVEAARA